MPQYNGVWTLAQQAQAQSNQQWATDPNFKNTTLLLQADNAANGATNNSFLDSSTNGFTITRNGNTTQGSFSPFSQAPGSWSNYFDGNASCDLQTPSDAAFGYGTGDFSLEAWVYQQTNANARIIDHTDDNFNLGVQSNGVVNFFSSATSYTTATGLVALNTWTHICATRQGSTLRIFVNGVLRYNTTFTNSKGTSAVNIGSNPGGGGETLNGYISNLRIVKGGVPSAYSTSSTTNGTTVFTPSTSPFVLSGSLTAGSLSLLTCQSNRFVDNSSNSFAISVTGGSPSVQAFGPFAPALQWTPDVVGGSGYFDGTDDYLLSPSTTAFNLGTGDFCIEMWFYWTGSGNGYFGLCGSQTDYKIAASLYNQKIMYGASSNGSSWNILAAESSLGSTTIIPNTWTNFVFCRTGTTISAFVNGVRDITITSSASIVSRTEGYVVGSWFSTLYRFLGYISNFRFVVGSNPYNAASTTITVPTAPTTAITNTQLLVNSTNAGIYDGKMANNLETVGNAQVSTSVVKYGSGSMYFPATNGNYCVSPPNQPTLLFGTGNFTVEAWVYPISFTNSAAGAFGYGLSGGYVDWNLEINTSGTVLYIDNDAGRFSSSSNLPTNTWTHLCVARTNTGVTMYFNGVSVGSYSTINNISGSSTSARLYVGTGAQAPASRQFIGYIDDLRITKGIARYIANFTPPQQALPRQ